MDMTDLSQFMTSQREEIPETPIETPIETPHKAHLRRPQTERHKADIEDLYEENMETRERLDDLYKTRASLIHGSETKQKPKEQNLEYFHKLYENSQKKEDNLMVLLNTKAEEEDAICTFKPEIDANSKEMFDRSNKDPIHMRYQRELEEKERRLQA